MKKKSFFLLEGRGSVIKTVKGGKTELLGTLIYPLEIFEEHEKHQAAFINNESSHSLIYSISADKPERNYPIQIDNGVIAKKSCYGLGRIKNRIMLLFVAYTK